MQQICNARLVGRAGLYTLVIDDSGKLLRVDPENQPVTEAGESIDLGGGWASQGLVDLQLNGALGIEFSELQDVAQLEKISHYLWSIGISGWLATLISVPTEKLQQAMTVIAQFETPMFGAKLLGVHLEGPFLNPEYEGVHLRHCLLDLNVENIQRVLGDYQSLVKLITVASELDPEGKAIPWLVERGILVSLGHTSATFAEAQRAFDQGANLITHLFNAQRPLHHREPGVIGAALLDDRIHCLCIPDGIHLHPGTTQLILKLKGTGRVLPVSDAVAPLGMPDGQFEWHGQIIRVEAGKVMREDGRLAGSALSLVDVAERLVSQVGVAPETALQLCANNPLSLLGITDFPVVGEPADLLLWHSEASRPVRFGIPAHAVPC
jgi:N-acetylglucosamine-6-phosphate deacetylase